VVGTVGARQAGTGSSEAQMLQGIWSELRGLRLAVERGNAVQGRIQIALQRLQLQQTQVNKLSNDLEGIRRELTRSEADHARASNVLAALESNAEQETDPEKQKRLRNEQRDVKSMLEERGRTVQELHVREAELRSSLQIEQSKLADLQGRLDLLERSVESPPAQ
jgi:chromosome segregation ATPase